MFKKLAVLLLAVVLILQTMPLSVIALADADTRSDDPAAYEMPYDSEYDEDDYESPYDVEEMEEEVEKSEDEAVEKPDYNVEAYSDFYDWTEEEHERWSQLHDITLQSIRSEVTRLSVRAEGVILVLGEGQIFENLQALNHAVHNEFFWPANNLWVIVNAEMISFADAYAQVNDLIAAGLNFIDEFEVALEDSSFYDWTEEEHERWSQLHDITLQSIRSEVTRLSVRAEGVMLVLGEGQIFENLQALNHAVHNEFFWPANDLWVVVNAEMMSFTELI